MNAYFKKLTDEWVSFSSKTIEAKALSGCEEKVTDIYLKEMEKIGIECFRDGCGNVIGILRGNGTGPNILLTGHMDIVPEGSIEAWNGIEPFKGTIKDGKLIGRGISDMLGGLNCAFFAFKEMKKAIDKGIELTGDIVFCGVVQEEPAESFGCLYFLEKTMIEHNMHFDLCYLAEPTDGNLSIGQRGKVELVVEVMGKVAHSSAPEQGINAVEKAQKIIEAAFNNFYKEPVKHKLGCSSMTLTDVVVKPGKMYSCVPDYCELTIDRRLVPPVTIQDTIDEIQEFIDKIAEKDKEFKAVVHQRINKRTSYTGYSMEVAKQHPAWYVEEDNEYVKLSKEVLEHIGQKPSIMYWRGGTDGSVICGKAGIPTIGYSGSPNAQAHQPGEYVVIDEMIDCMEGYTAMLCKIYDIDFSIFE